MILPLHFYGSVNLDGRVILLQLLNVSNGDNLTVDLVGTNFNLGPDGAAFSLAWNPAVLSYVSTAISNPSWDSSSVKADSAALGLIDYVFLSSLALSNDPYDVGFVSPGALPINVNYVNSQVQVAPVPVPAAAWLFGTGLMSLLGSMRIRKNLPGAKNI